MMIRDSDFFEEIITENLKADSLSPKDRALNLIERVRETDYSKEMEDDCTIIVIRV